MLTPVNLISKLYYIVKDYKIIDARDNNDAAPLANG